MGHDTFLSSNAPIHGIEFIEILATNLDDISPLLSTLGFTLKAKHRRKDVYLFIQNHIKLVINCSKDTELDAYRSEKGTSFYAIALKCTDAQLTHKTLLDRGAWDSSSRSGPMEINIPGIEGVGGTLVYLVDHIRDDLSIYDIDFKDVMTDTVATPTLGSINTLQFNVDSGRKQAWTNLFKTLFELSESGDGKLSFQDNTKIEFIEQGLSGSREPLDSQECLLSVIMNSLDNQKNEPTCHTLKGSQQRIEVQ